MYGRSVLLQCTENIISETNVAKSPASRCIVKDAIQVLQNCSTIIIEELWQLFHIVYHDELHKLVISKDIIVMGIVQRLYFTFTNNNSYTMNAHIREMCGPDQSRRA